jgi:hypothetical protein
LKSQKYGFATKWEEEKAQTVVFEGWLAGSNSAISTLLSLIVTSRSVSMNYTPVEYDTAQSASVRRTVDVYGSGF